MIRTLLKQVKQYKKVSLLTPLYTALEVLMEKFTRAAENLYRLFVKAEGLLALNNPVMMLVVYGCMLSLSWFGAHYIVIGNLTTGELTSMFSYVMSVFMSLMMLSMVFVMLTMSAASGRRIAEVLEEKADLADPEHPVT